MNYMRCTTTEDLLSAIKFAMINYKIQQKDIAINIGKSEQSVSQFFTNANPQCNNIFNMLAAMDLVMEVRFVSEDDIK